MAWMKFFRNTKASLLKRLGAELEIDEFRGEAFDLLASAYHKVRLQRAAKRMMKTRRRYEELMARDSREVLQEALGGSAGLEDVVESLGSQARGVLMNALEHVDEIVDAPPNVEAIDVPVRDGVALTPGVKMASEPVVSAPVRRKPAL